MAINDRFMLPKRVRTMEQMADLLAAEQAELEQTQRTIMALEDQLTISTSTHLLPRHERLFDLPVNTTESLEVRRARVLARLNTRGTTTVRAIRDIVEIITGQDSDVIEHFDQYAFSVLIRMTKNAVINVEELAWQIERIKPAHLLFSFDIPSPPVHSALYLGGALAALNWLSMPESPDEMQWLDALRAGGGMAQVSVLPVPEAPDGMKWLDMLRTGGAAAILSTMPISEQI